MMRTKMILLTIVAALVISLPSAFAQTGERRIMQSITVNGQPAQGAMIVRNGAVQTYTCQSPQQYVTTDRSESGWACYDQATGMWLMHAQPPSQAATVYSEPNTVYVPTPAYDYSYIYPYPYYPYSYYGYPYYWGPGVGLGFGFNFGHGGRGFHDGHGFHDGGHGFSHGGGGFGHGFSHGGGFGGGHMGGGHMGGGFHGGGHR
jgi:hypothetical protein